jgi:AcrR family transcriptional regulator
MSPAALYSHFDSKHQLLYEISRFTHKISLEVLQAVPVVGRTPTDRLASLMRAFAAFHATYHTAARVAEYELHSLLPEHFEEIVKLRRAHTQLMREAIRLGMVAGDLDVEDLDATTRALLSLGIDVSRWYSPAGRLTPSEVGERYAQLALRLVRGYPPISPQPL